MAGSTGIRFIGAVLLALATTIVQARPGEAAGSAAKGTPIDASYTGAWYDPTHTGEGFLLEILDGDQALAYWFTYDQAGNQLWVVATGTITGNRIDFVDGLAPRGARFGSAFDPDDVVLGEPWGSWSMTFDGCDSAALEYSSVLGDGTQDLIRLTGVEGFDCTTAAAKVLNGSMTGAWFDDQRVGEGFLIDVIGPATALVYWFTYDLDGNPFWITAVGDVVANRIVAAESFSTTGGVFGPDFDPDTVELIPFGPLAFAFDGSGDAGAVTAIGPEAFGGVDMSLNRLTRLQGTEVTFDASRRLITATVAGANNTVVDGDVNDPNVAFRANDATAQPLPNPVRLVGFASATGSGLPGSRFADEGDQADFYGIELAAGQAVALAIADHDADDDSAVDLDLFLLDANGDTVAASQGFGRTEEVVAPGSGTFIVGVVAFAGASNYALATGNPTGAAAKIDPFAPMVDKEAIVRLREGGKRDLAALLAAKALQVKAGDPERELLLDLAGAKGVDTRRRWLEERLAAVGGRLTDAADWDTVLALKAAAAGGAFALVEPNYVHQALALPSDTRFDLHWHYKLIDLPRAWDLTVGDPDVVVAVIDTGVAPHPDNRVNVDFSLGFDAVSNTLRALDGDGIDADANDPGDRSNPDGSGGYHGTHVAGTVAADSDNGATGLGLTGTAWNVTVMPVRVLGRGGSGTTFDIIEGFRWATGLANATGTRPARRADIVNMSLGGPGASQAFQDVIDRARQRGVIVVAAAGNSGRSETIFPAGYDGVISVSATTITDQLAPYSTFGPAVDIAAPGGDTSTDLDGDGFADGVLSLSIDDSVRPRRPTGLFLNGTSMAAPHVAGVAALMKSVFPELSPRAFDLALARGDLTVDLADDGAAVRDDRFGFGRIDAARAVAWAADRAGSPVDAPALRASVSSVLLDAMTDRAPLTLDNAGSGALRLTQITTTQPWLGLLAVAVDANGLGDYEIVVDRAGLPTGRFQGVLTFSSDAGTVAVTVTIDVGEVAVPGEIGTTYLIAVDPLTFGSLAQAVLTEPGARAELGPLLPGEYLVAGGTDLDNDGLVCDAGELCGAFPTLSEIEAVELGDTDLDVGTIVVGTPNQVQGLSTTSTPVAPGFRRR